MSAPPRRARRRRSRPCRAAGRIRRPPQLGCRSALAPPPPPPRAEPKSRQRRSEAPAILPSTRSPAKIRPASRSLPVASEADLPDQRVEAGVCPYRTGGRLEQEAGQPVANRGIGALFPGEAQLG